MERRILLSTHDQYTLDLFTNVHAEDKLHYSLWEVGNKW